MSEGTDIAQNRAASFACVRKAKANGAHPPMDCEKVTGLIQTDEAPTQKGWLRPKQE